MKLITNSSDAHKLDKGSIYEEFDTDTNNYGVFGTESGFCYATFADRRDAVAYVKEKAKPYKQTKLRGK